MHPGSLWKVLHKTDFIGEHWLPSPYSDRRGQHIVSVNAGEVLLFLEAKLSILTQTVKSSGLISMSRSTAGFKFDTKFTYCVIWNFLRGDKIIKHTGSISSTRVDEKYTWATIADPSSMRWFMTEPMEKHFLSQEAPRIMHLFSWIQPAKNPNL